MMAFTVAFRVHAVTTTLHSLGPCASLTRTGSQTGPAVAIRAGEVESHLYDDDLDDSGCTTWTARLQVQEQKNENAEIYIGPSLGMLHRVSLPLTQTLADHSPVQATPIHEIHRHPCPPRGLRLRNSGHRREIPRGKANVSPYFRIHLSSLNTATSPVSVQHSSVCDLLFRMTPSHHAATQKRLGARPPPPGPAH